MRRLATILLATTAAHAVDWTSADLGAQPVAIGAGARALGLGGAFAAIADDATASTWNPAGLTQCERPELAASLGWNHTAIEADQHDRRHALRPEHASAMLPFFAGGCMQVVGVAWQRQYDFTRDLALADRAVDVIPGMFTITIDEQRAFRRSGSLASLGASYAIEVQPGFSLGATLNAWGDRLTGASHYRLERDQNTALRIEYEPWMGLPPDIETRIGVLSQRTSVRSGLSVVLGAMWQATPELTLAAVAKPGYHLGLRSDIAWHEVVDHSVFGSSENRSTSTASARLSHPPSLTLGAAWRPDDLNALSCDATVTRWRLYRLEDAAGQHSPVSVFLAPDRFDDLWTLRAGYERIVILPQSVLVPRVGALVEWLPAATAAPSLSRADEVSATSDLWLGLTAGASLAQRRVIWDAAVQVRRGDDVGAGQFAGLDRTADLTVTTVRLGVTVQF